VTGPSTVTSPLRSLCRQRSQVCRKAKPKPESMTGSLHLDWRAQPGRIAHTLRPLITSVEDPLHLSTRWCKVDISACIERNRRPFASAAQYRFHVKGTVALGVKPFSQGLPLVFRPFCCEHPAVFSIRWVMLIIALGSAPSKREGPQAGGACHIDGEAQSFRWGQIFPAPPSSLPRSPAFNRCASHPSVFFMNNTPRPREGCPGEVRSRQWPTLASGSGMCADLARD